MARVRIPEETLKSWDEVNLCLAEIGECQRSIESIEADMQAAIDTAKLEASVRAERFLQRIATLELQMKSYVEAHADEMGGKKTKMLQFGQMGYRRSTKIIVPQKGTKLAVIISRLRDRGMNDCIVVKEPTVNKDALKKYPANDILDVGANIKTDDTFWYEVDRESLQEH